MWMIFAVGASVFWGICYVINEQVYRHISVLTSLALTMLAAGVVSLAIALATNVFGRDIATITSSPKVLTLLVLGIVVFIAAELFIGFSVSNKNATIAGLIEISYPIFIALFSYLFFKESNLNLATAIGAAFVFTGIGIVYVFNR